MLTVRRRGNAFCGPIFAIQQELHTEALMYFFGFFMSMELQEVTHLLVWFNHSRIRRTLNGKQKCYKQQNTTGQGD